MRYAVLSDVHANLHALRAVLADSEQQGVDEHVFAGDVVGYGPFPNECVELLHARRVVCVAGNHDLIAAGLLDTEACSPFAKEALAWTRQELREDVLQILTRLPSTVTCDDLVVTHGSLDSPVEYVRSEQRASALLRELSRRAPRAAVLVLGHTHLPWVYSAEHGTLLRGRGSTTLRGSQPHLLNPGSVGQSRDRSPEARYAIFDAGTRTVSIRSVAYDVDACRRALSERHRPVTSCHERPPSVRRRLSARLTRARRTAGAGLS